MMADYLALSVSAGVGFGIGTGFGKFFDGVWMV